MKYFKFLFTWELNPWYTANSPRVARFLLKKGHVSQTPCPGIMDRMVEEDVIFNPYTTC